MRLVAGFVLALSLSVASLSAQSRAPFRHYEADGRHYLIGCMADEDAEHFLRMGFEFGSGGSPFLVLCVEGYSQMTKPLN